MYDSCRHKSTSRYVQHTEYQRSRGVCTSVHNTCSVYYLVTRGVLKVGTENTIMESLRNSEVTDDKPSVCMYVRMHVGKWATKEVIFVIGAYKMRQVCDTLNLTANSIFLE